MGLILFCRGWVSSVLRAVSTSEPLFHPFTVSLETVQFLFSLPRALHSQSHDHPQLMPCGKTSPLEKATQNWTIQYTPLSQTPVLKPLFFFMLCSYLPLDNWKFCHLEKILFTLRVRDSRRLRDLPEVLLSC